MLIGSPMCTAFCQLQCINFKRMDPERVRKILTRARMHLAFCCKLYRLQLSEGRHFIHEHPATATSWSEPCVKRGMRLPGVQVVVADACQYGMEGMWRGAVLPIRKSTKWMSDMHDVVVEMSKRCAGARGHCDDGREHTPCTGTRATQAAVYPLKTCQALLRGVTKHLQKQGILHVNCIGMQGTMDGEEKEPQLIGVLELKTDGIPENMRMDLAEDFSTKSTATRVGVQLIVWTHISRYSPLPPP